MSSSQETLMDMLAADVVTPEEQELLRRRSARSRKTAPRRGAERR